MNDDFDYKADFDFEDEFEEEIGDLEDEIDSDEDLLSALRSCKRTK